MSTVYSARYTKIGRTCHVSCYVQAATGNGTSQQPIILGLPFTATSAGNAYSYGSGRVGNGASSGLSGNDIVFQIKLDMDSNKAKDYVESQADNYGINVGINDINGNYIEDIEL